METVGPPILTMNDKTFWPDAWDEAKVIDEIKIAKNGSTLVSTASNGDKTYKGFTSTGQEITLVLSSIGKLKTAYPKL